MKQFIAYFALMILGFTLSHLKAQHQANEAAVAAAASTITIEVAASDVHNLAVDADLVVTLATPAN